MQCTRCGQVLESGSRFCSKCGTAVSERAAETLAYATTAADRIPADEPLMVLRPKFIGWTSMLTTIPIALFMTVWGAGFCGGFSTIGIKALQRATGVSIPGYVAPVFFGCAFFFGIPIYTFVRKWRSYAKTEYRFYRDRLEYYEGFFTIEQKVVYYKDVFEVHLSKGMIQRRYGLGSIVLTTVAGSTGVKAVDIENPDGTYDEVKRLIHDAKTAGPASQKTN